MMGLSDLQLIFLVTPLLSQQSSGVYLAQPKVTDFDVERKFLVCTHDVFRLLHHKQALRRQQTDQLTCKVHANPAQEYKQLSWTP